MTSKKVTHWIIEPKGKQPAHIGASVIHPDGSVGTVVGGQSSVSFGGKPAACVGDKVECPGHTGVIIQGAKSVSIGGKSLAREGDKTSCGGIIMNGFPTITVNDLTKTIHGKSEAEHTKEIKLSLFQSAHSKQSSYIGMPYRVFIEGKEIGQGIIDNEGALYFEIKDSDSQGEILLGNGQSYQIKLVDSIAPQENAQGYPYLPTQPKALEKADAYRQLLKDSEND